MQIKAANVQNLFNKLKLNINVMPCVKSEQEYAYRNKVTMYLNQNNKLCFNKRKSNNLLEIKKCCLIDDNFNNLINKLNIFFEQNKEFNSFVLKAVAIRKINNSKSSVISFIGVNLNKKEIEKLFL